MVVILLDSGSTHSFLDPVVLSRVLLPVDTTVKLQVRVANGAKVDNEGRCHSVTLKIQGHMFTTTFYLIPLGGCDMVLDVDWLSTLDLVLWDFNLMTM